MRKAALIAAGAARHYAIPSSVRCIQCHMGSPSQSFVLGFTPLQINRRPDGVGGTIEATGTSGDGIDLRAGGAITHEQDFEIVRVDIGVLGRPAKEVIGMFDDILIERRAGSDKHRG